MTATPGPVAPGFPEPRALPGRGRILIAFSGGADSVCLAANLIQSASDRPLLAVHIDHRLDPGSQQRAEYAQTLADQLGIDLHLERLDPPPDGGEAGARAARYGVFARLVQDDELLVTGHHADDQAETVLLRLLRGAGPMGLKGIPEQRRFGRGWLVRPLLSWSRDEVIDWLQKHNLRYQADPTNLDTAIDRNFLRQRIMPVLESRWPGLRQSIARSATLGQGATRALEALAAMDFLSARVNDYCLDQARLQALGRYRHGQVLRHWCFQRGIDAPPARQIDNFQDQLEQAAADRQPTLQWQKQRFILWRQQLWLAPSRPNQSAWQRQWQFDTPLRLPGDLGTLALEGKQAPRLPPVMARLGRPGERIRLPGQKHSRAIKQLMADLGVPPWQRDLWPRLEGDGRVLAIGSRWLDAEFAAELARAGCDLRWLQPPDDLVQ